MEIAFIGDVHGRVCHALSVLLVWQSERKRPFDLVVQVGDLGVFPDPRTGEVPYDRFEKWDPSVYDLARLILMDGVDATLPGRVREHLARPILVTPGNHDEFEAHRSLDEEEPGHPQPIDPHGIFEYVPDGFVHQDRYVRVGFCEAGDPGGLDSRSEDAVDVLVSHEGGFGVDAESDGLAPGPDAMLSFLKKRKPAFHVFGHFHHPVAPRRVYDTMCVQVASVVSDARRSQKPVVHEGCMGVLNTGDWAFEFVTGDWLGSYPRESGFHFLAETVDRLDSEDLSPGRPDTRAPRCGDSHG